MLSQQTVCSPVPEAGGLSASRLVRGIVERSKQRVVNRDVIKPRNTGTSFVI
jgi:hypothetical protein